MERVKGIEPSSSAWKAAALPLSYTRAPDLGRRWWRRLDSNQRRLSQRIYSPSPLATRALLHSVRPLIRSSQDGFTDRPVQPSGVSCGACYADRVPRCQRRFGFLSRKFVAIRFPASRASGPSPRRLWVSLDFGRFREVLHRLGRNGPSRTAMQQKEDFQPSGFRRICQDRRISGSFMQRKALFLFPVSHIESRRAA